MEILGIVGPVFDICLDFAAIIYRGTSIWLFLYLLTMFDIMGRVFDMFFILLTMFDVSGSVFGNVNDFEHVLFWGMRVLHAWHFGEALTRKYFQTYVF